MRDILLVTLSCLFLLSTAQAQNNADFAQDQIVVKFKQDAEIQFKNCLLSQKFNHQELDSLNKAFGLKKIVATGNKKEALSYLLIFKKDLDILNLIEVYSKTALFEYVEPNYIGSGAGKEGVMQTIPNDNYFDRQYSLVNDGSFSLSPSTVDADIDMELAWDIEQGSSSVIVAVLDAGIKMDHPEFSGRIWNNAYDIINNTDDDNNGYIDDWRGWDFANDDNDPTDDHGHGTNVAGILAANGNNNIGYAGVDWNCKVMSCKILDANNYGLYTWWADAIYYAVDQGAKVLNMSVGGSGFSQLLSDAITYAASNGAIVVACMMNEDNNVVYYPAGFNSTIAVGSTDANDDRSSPFFWSSTSGSCFGNHIDVVAPGNFIYGLSYSSNTNYGSYWGGTSQATPHVAGLCALLLAQDTSRTLSQVRNIIRSTAQDQVGDISEDIPGFDPYFGYGRINAHQALLWIGVEDDLSLEVQDLLVSPNPASNSIRISHIEDCQSIELYDINGRLFLSKQLSANSFQDDIEVDITEFPSGIYFISAKGLKHQKKSKLVVL